MGFQTGCPSQLVKSVNCIVFTISNSPDNSIIKIPEFPVRLEINTIFDKYIEQVAEIVITGAINGTDDMLEAIYRSFAPLQPLPPARRHPRRLKMWVVPS